MVSPLPLNIFLDPPVNLPALWLEIMIDIGKKRAIMREMRENDRYLLSLRGGTEGGDGGEGGGRTFTDIANEAFTSDELRNSGLSFDLSEFKAKREVGHRVFSYHASYNDSRCYIRVFFLWIGQSVPITRNC